jgi:excisionase family DNA binding protein
LRRADAAQFKCKPTVTTLTEVAQTLNVSSAQTYALVRTGDLPAIKLGGRGQWRVEACKFQEFISHMYAETEASLGDE